MRTPQRLLVVKLASLGDLLTITPTLRALRSTFPQAHIGVLTTPSSASTLRGLDSFDEIIPFDKFAFDRPSEAALGLPRAIALAARLRRGNWDTLLLLHHLTTVFGIAKYAALALGSGAGRRVGLEHDGLGWFLTEAAVDDGFGARHEVDYWLSVAARLGARHPGTPRIELHIAPDDEGWLRPAGESREPSALLVPGSGAFSRARRWAPERFAAIGRALHARHGLRPLVLSGIDPDEQALAQQVAATIGSQARVVPTAPSPQGLAALIRRCHVVVANDSGPVHVATAVETPVVAIFGPTNARAWGPYPPDAARNQVVRETLACSPCIHRGHSFGTPQGCAARTCLAIIETSAVLDAVERALGAAPNKLYA